MKKVFTLIAVAGLCCFSSLKAAELVNDYDINENFESYELGAINWGLGGTYTATVIQDGDTINHGKVLRLTASGTGNRIDYKDLGEIRLSEDNKVYVEFDWMANKGQNLYGDANSGGYLFFYDTDNNLILGFNIDKQTKSNALHCLNLDTTVIDIPSDSATLVIPPTGYFGGKDQWVHMVAILDYTTKSIDLTITSDTVVYNHPNLPFHTSQAGLLKKLSVKFLRGSTGANRYVPCLDNLQVYHKRESAGTANASINYIDREGNTIKPATVFNDQQIGFGIQLSKEDKARFADDAYYYVYDEAATHASNVTKGLDGESLTVVAGDTNRLNVVYKKTAITNGLYVWSGAASATWNELEDNFSVNKGAAISYQKGNAVEFSDAEATNKEIVINDVIEMDSSRLTISAAGYSLTGTGSITGTDTLYVNAPATLAVSNQLAGGAIINTSALTLAHASPATKLKLNVDKTYLNLEPNGAFSTPIEGMGGELFIKASVGANYSPIITNSSVVNLELPVSGSKSNYWVGSFPKHTAQLNVISSEEGMKAPTGFAVNESVLDSVKVHLGDNVRMIRYYNENDNGNSTIRIGELTGSPNSFIEGGYVNGRACGYEIGSLGTDAVFDGSIRPYLSRVYEGAVIDSSTMERLPDSLAWSISGLKLSKVGKGSWTVNGKITMPNPTATKRYNAIIAKEGILILSQKIAFSSDSVPHLIQVKAGATLILKDSIITEPGNQMVTTVDTLGVLECNNTYLGTNIVDVLGTLKGGVTVPNSFSAYDSATIKMTVNSFAEGDYHMISAQGDVTVIGSVLDITVNASTAGMSIPMITSMGNMDLGFSKVLVNGVDITENTPETEGADFAWFFDEANNAGSLMCMKTASSLKNPVLQKVVKEVQYYNVLGQSVKANTKGLVIEKVVFEDNTVETRKTINQ